MSLRRGTRKRMSENRFAKKQLQAEFNKRAVFATGALRIFLGGANKVKDKNSEFEMFNILLSAPLARAVCEAMGWDFTIIGDGSPGFEWPGIATDGIDVTIPDGCDRDAACTLSKDHDGQCHFSSAVGDLTEPTGEVKAEDGGPLIILGR